MQEVNSTHDYCTVLPCIEPFIIILPWSRYDLNNVEKDVKHQISIIYQSEKGNLALKHWAMYINPNGDYMEKEGRLGRFVSLAQKVKTSLHILTLTLSGYIQQTTY